MNKLLDTNIVLYFLAGKIEKLPSATNYYISIITEIELLFYPVLNTAEEKKLGAFWQNYLL